MSQGHFLGSDLLSSRIELTIVIVEHLKGVSQKILSPEPGDYLGINMDTVRHTKLRITHGPFVDTDHEIIIIIMITITTTMKVSNFC